MWLSYHLTTVGHHLRTGMRPSRRVTRRFCHCAHIIEGTDTGLGGAAYTTHLGLLLLQLQARAACSCIEYRRQL